MFYKTFFWCTPRFFVGGVHVTLYCGGPTNPGRPHKKYDGSYACTLSLLYTHNVIYNITVFIRWGSGIYSTPTDFEVLKQECAAFYSIVFMFLEAAEGR